METWLDPPLQTDFQLGGSVSWHAAFMDRITKVITDPDIVQFTVAASGVGSTTYTYPSLILRDATGLYRLEVPLTSAGAWSLQVNALGNPGAVGIGTASLTLQVYA